MTALYEDVIKDKTGSPDERSAQQIDVKIRFFDFDVAAYRRLTLHLETPRAQARQKIPRV